jgi:solute:Na+ symporter, SSS family
MAEPGGGVMERALSSLQIAALLVSASYGIGFLFGTGELALAHGMAGSIYGIATAFGMLALAVVARPLWSSGLSVWDLFGKAYGVRLRGWVAVLSLVWMAGVLAAQIHGGVAVARLLGLADPYGLLLVLSLVFVASRMDLRVASGVFSACLLASGLVLAYALFASGGVGYYTEAVPAFLADMDTFRPTQFWTVSLAVCLLVVTGADYHQFLMSGQSARSAVMGCVLAGIALFFIAFLPSAVVLAMQSSGALMDLPDGKQVIPWALSQVAGSLAEGLGSGMLLALSLAVPFCGRWVLRSARPCRRGTQTRRGWHQPLHFCWGHFSPPGSKALLKRWCRSTSFTLRALACALSPYWPTSRSALSRPVSQCPQASWCQVASMPQAGRVCWKSGLTRCR